MKLALVLHKYGVPLDDPCSYPLGFMYISAVLKKSGHDVAVFNLNLWDEMPKVDCFDAVLMTGFEEFLPTIKAMGAECKGYGVKIILGGALATFKPQEMLQYVDTVIIGEGESVIETAINSYGIVQGHKPNIDCLPFPDYGGFGVSEYHRRTDVKHMGVLTSRGCTWSCKFCAQTCNFQYRSLSKVFEEIDLYREKYKPELIVFNDNTLNIAKPRFMQICREMSHRGLAWTAAIRVDKFDNEMAVAAKNSGCKYFVVGVESFKQEKLDEMNKKITVNQIYQTLDLLHKHKINYYGNILTGFPGETVEDILDELMAIPEGYNVLPVLVQPFAGTQYQSRGISKEHTRIFVQMFKEKAIAKGMHQFPLVESGE